MRFRTVLETRVIGMWVRREGVSWSGAGVGKPCVLQGLGSGPGSFPLPLLSPTSSLARLPHVLSMGIEATGHKESIKSSPSQAREHGAKALIEEA